MSDDNSIWRDYLAGYVLGTSDLNMLRTATFEDDDDTGGTSDLKLLETATPEAQNAEDGNMGGRSNLNHHESAAPKAQNDDVNEQLRPPDHSQSESSMIRIVSTKRRHQFVSENLSEAEGKGTKKKQRCRGESSSASPQPKPTVEKKLKNLKDAFSRRKIKDMMADMVPYMLLMSAQKKIQWPLPLRSDMKDVAKRIEKIESDIKKAIAQNPGITTLEVTNDELERRVAEVREVLVNLNEQRRQDSKKMKELETIFINNMDVSAETLREKLFGANLWHVFGETATNGLTVDLDQGTLQTREQLQSTFSYLLNQLYAMDNNKVDITDFNGLKEALEKTSWGKTPDYLEPIATRIEKARGKATEVSHYGIQVLVCAAIQEMEELPLKDWNWETLKKWGATLNKAKELGFRVEFAENILTNNLYAYFAYSENVG